MFLLFLLNISGQQVESEIKINLEQIYKKYDVKLRPHLNKVKSFREIHDQLHSEKRLDYSLKIRKEEKCIQPNFG